MPSDFQIAASRARARVGDREWDDVPLPDQTRRLYQELRAIDAERVAEWAERDESQAA
jgi:hypothetical protein